ncbi:MAG: hypothetical protein L6R41_005355 [Letrouitia leprolyta]|nr:MAG: hypothetical protein L6R41_005355 [Letrouitia leprolyta]
MPAKRNGPRKGQIGKKAQIEKMVETATTKKAPILPKIKPTTANASSKVSAGNVNGHGTAVQNPHPGSDKSGVVKFSSGKQAVVRLPCQGSVSLPKKLPLSYTQPKPPNTTLPKAYQNPNRVVVRLPVKQTSKEPTTFLSLPSEIRNIIYDYAMPCRKYGIKFIPRESKFEKRPKELTYYHAFSVSFSGPGLTARHGECRRLFDLPKRLHMDKAIPTFSLSPSQASLLIVSKKVNEETTPMLYGRNGFFFQSMQPLRKFLDSLRPETRSMLRSLHIVHHTAGNPCHMEHQTWKDLHDRCWHKLCFQIRDQCTGLHNLAIDLTINDIPFETGPLAGWMSPLYAFMNLDHLNNINLKLRQMMTKDAILQVHAYEIRKELMGANFYEPRTPMDDVFVVPPKQQVRPKVGALRITGNLRPQPTQNGSVIPTHGTHEQIMDHLMKLPSHLLPTRHPVPPGYRGTVFWRAPDPIIQPPFYPAGPRGDPAVQRRKRLERQEKKSKGKGKAKA